MKFPQSCRPRKASMGAPMKTCISAWCHSRSACHIQAALQASEVSKSRTEPDLPSHPQRGRHTRLTTVLPAWWAASTYTWEVREVASHDRRMDLDTKTRTAHVCILQPFSHLQNHGRHSFVRCALDWDVVQIHLNSGMASKRI